MSNVGMMTGLSAIEVVNQVEPGKAGIFCLGGLPTYAPKVLTKTKAVKWIVTVDGYTLNWSLKIVEQAGFTLVITITLVINCGIQNKSYSEFKPKDMVPTVEEIVNAINGG